MGFILPEVGRASESAASPRPTPLNGCLEIPSTHWRIWPKGCAKVNALTHHPIQ